MSPLVMYFIPSLLEDADKYIEVTNGNYARANQKGKFQIRVRENNGDTFIATLNNVLL